MQRRGGFNFNMLLNRQTFIFAVVLSIPVVVCLGGEYSSESESFFQFIKAVDPQDKLKVSDQTASNPNPCLQKWNFLKCNSQASTILEIWLENFHLSGILDSESLCKLQNLRVISLAKNRIQGTIPSSILNCTKLNYLNLSSNLLNGTIPKALTRLKYLRRLDISNNNFTSTIPFYKEGFKQHNLYSRESNSLVKVKDRKILEVLEVQESNSSGESQKSHKKKWTKWILWITGVGFFLVFFYFVGKSIAKLGNEREVLKPSPLQDDLGKTSPGNSAEEVKQEEKKTELVFFVEEHETFKLEELLEATANLTRQSICSSLFKVSLKNNGQFAVKRLKKVKVSLEEFGETMRQIGNLKHPNILPLVGYASNHVEKLLIYKYQSSGSLLNLLESKF